VTVPMAAQSDACVCGPSLVVIAGANPAGFMDVCILLALCGCQVEISASGRSLVCRSPTECCVCIECDREVL
jgi:hypothetical protein